MIQRKQTLFMLIAIILSVICLCLPVATFISQGISVPTEMYNLRIVSGNGLCDFSSWPLFALLLFTLLVGVWSIFAYRNRKLQARLCVVNVLVLIAWYIFFAIFSLNLLERLNAEFTVAIPASFPAISIILYLMARRGVIADEKLVRSMDRIR